MSGSTGDRAPLFAAVAVALLMAGMVAFWALFSLVGGNGFNTSQGGVWLCGNMGAAVVAWIAAPWWAARRCKRWIRGGWHAAAAVFASVALAIATAALLLFVVAVAMAGVMESLR